MLKFNTVHQELMRVDNGYTVADSINYLTAHFRFTSDWAGLSKKALFTLGETTHAVILNAEDMIVESMHLNLGAGTWKVAVIGNELIGEEVKKRITTNECFLKVYPSSVKDGEPLPEVPLSYGEQIEDIAQNAVTIAESARESASSAQSAAENAEGQAQLSASAAQTAQAMAESAAISAQASANAAESAQNAAEAASVRTPYIGANGNWYVWDAGSEEWADTGTRARGDTGNGIDHIAKTGTEGLVDTYTVSYTDGGTDTFTVTNGEKGAKGDTGDVSIATLFIDTDSGQLRMKRPTNYLNQLVYRLVNGRLEVGING